VNAAALLSRCDLKIDDIQIRFGTPIEQDHITFNDHPFPVLWD
jgi:hypothetical protein